MASGGDFVSVLSFDPVLAPVGTTFVTILPVNTFFHSDPSTPLVYEATLADGSPLPAWLRFDSTARSFSATAPDDAEAVEVVVTARDPAGHRAQTKLVLNFVKKTADTGTVIVQLKASKTQASVLAPRASTTARRSSRNTSTASVEVAGPNS